jgi:hypothetical protein
LSHPAPEFEVICFVPAIATRIILYVLRPIREFKILDKKGGGALAFVEKNGSRWHYLTFKPCCIAMQETRG